MAERRDLGATTVPREALKNTHITFLRTSRPPGPEAGRTEGTARGEGGPASAGHGSKQAPASHPREERGGQAMCSQRENMVGGGPKGKSQKESRFVRKPNSQPPEATGHAPTPSACYGSSSERLRETKSLESGSRDFRRERGQPPEAVDKVPLGGFQVGSLETYCVGDTRQVLFLLNVSESHLDGSNDLVTSRTFLLWQ